jgi:hypothetical protein
MGIMQREEFIHTLLSAAAFLKDSLEALASQSLKDAYAAAKSYLAKKLGIGSSANRALDLAVEKPESETRKSLLAEESAGLEMDPEFCRLGETLAAMLPANMNRVRQNVRVTGRGNRVQVAGGDIITTTRQVHRNVLTPGNGHLDAGQRKKLVALIAEVADRFAGEDGRPRFGAVHAMLQQHFGVVSYLMIPADKFGEAVGFLQRQRALHRSRLWRRNPAAYRMDFLRMIHARRLALGWLKPQVYAFATEKLGLKNSLTSLLTLGPVQLKMLAELMRHESRKTQAAAVPDPTRAATDERR